MTSHQGELLCQNSFHDNMVNNGARDLLFFFNIPYLTILSTLEVSENTFSHQNITFYAFFSIRPPTRGSFYVKILFMITWLIMELETYFFFLIYHI